MNRRQNVLKTLATMFSALTVVLSLAIAPASAATSSSTQSVTGAGNGIKISPVRSELTINPGSSATLDVFVTNVTSQAATFQLLANDFVAAGDESGNPAVILNPNQAAPSHGLKQYIAPISNITIQPQQTKDVKVVITMPDDIAAGGYYGAVRVAPAGSSQQNNRNITLSASVASLILVKVPGNIKEQLSIASFDARNGDKSRSIFTSKKNISGVVRFQNEGNIQEAPFGKIVLKDIRGHQIASYEINNTNPKGNVLPNSIRKFNTKLDHLSSFGRYTIEGNFGYGSAGQLLTAKSTFYIIPIPVIVILIILAVLIIVAIFEIPRLIRGYNRRVLRRAGRE